MATTIVFRVECPTKPVEVIALVGSNPELGKWDPSKRTPMHPSCSTEALDLSTNLRIWETDPLYIHSSPFYNCFEYKFVVVNTVTGEIRWEQLPKGKNRKYVSKHLSVTLRHTMHQPETIEEDTQFNIMESVKFAGDYELDHKERKSSATEDIYDDLETRTNQIFKADDDEESSSGSSTIEDPIPLIKSKREEWKITQTTTRKNEFKFFLEIEKKNPYRFLFNTFVKQGVHHSKILSSTTLISPHEVQYPKHEFDMVKVTKSELVIFVTHVLPIIIRPFGEETVMTEVDYSATEYFYCYMADNFKDNYENVTWIGFLQIQEEWFKYEASIQQMLWEKYHMIPILVSVSEFKKYKRDYCEALYEMYSETLFASEDRTNLNKNLLSSYELHHSYNRRIAGLISDVILGKGADPHSMDTLVFLNDYQVSLVPHYLATAPCSSTKLNIALNMFSTFPKYEVFRGTPFSKELLTSMLHSDIVSFNSFQSAKNFIFCCQQIFSVHYGVERHVHLTISYLGRRIEIRVAKTTVDFKLLAELSMGPRFERASSSLAPSLADKSNVLIIECMTENTSPMKTMNIIMNILQRNPDLQETTQFYYWIKSTKEKNIQKIEEIKKFIDFLNSRLKRPAITILQGLPYTSRILYLKHTDVLINLDIHGRPNLEIYELVYVNNRQAKILVNSPSEYQSPIPTITGINSLEEQEIIEQLESAITHHVSRKQDIASGRASEDVKRRLKSKEEELANTRKFLEKNDIWSWFECVLLDFKRTISDQKEAVMVHLEDPLGSKFVTLRHAKYLLETSFYAHLGKSTKRLFIFSFENVLDKNDLHLLQKHTSQGSSASLGLDLEAEVQKVLQIAKENPFLQQIERLTSDPNNQVYILTSLPRSFMSTIFGDMKNLWIFAEDGFYYRNLSISRKWKAITQFMKDWQNPIEKIIYSYMLKTGGSSVVKTPTSITFEGGSILGDLAKLQAQELYGSLKNLLENNNRIEVFQKHKMVSVKINILPKVNSHSLPSPSLN